MEDPDDDSISMVVVNDAKQCSIWPAEKAFPAGWKSAGKTGTRTECLQYIEEVWTDTRPLSLGNKMDKGGA
jgi:MbtH protein